MRVLLISVGTPKNAGIAEAIGGYEDRISHYFKYESLEVRGTRNPPGGRAGPIAERESRELLARVPAGLDVVALDERGERWSSERLAAYLAELATLGRPGVAFLVGGAAGLSESLRRSANHVVSLSSLTLPHELARLIMVEQIYRAGTINRGEPYHRGG